MKAPSVKGGGAVLVRMSLSDGGDARSDEVEAGGMRARLVGRDVVMVESPSPSSRTDDGCGDPSLASLEAGREVIGVGECLRSCAFGILPASSLASQRRMTLTAGAAKLNIVQTEMTGSPFSSFLPIQHDDGGARHH